MNPADLKYAKTHEWIHIDTGASGEKIATVGLSAFAVEALTDLVFIDLPEVGRELAAGESFGEIESVKAVSDIYAPVAGTVVEVNAALPDALETLNKDPYGDGWMMKIKVSDDSAMDQLLDASGYDKQCAEEV